MSDPTHLQHKMSELGALFLQRTKREAETLRELLARVRGGDATAFAEIEHLSHRICGTGATLGFEQISEHASQIERLAEGRTTTDFAVLQQLEKCLSDLEQTLQTALK